MNAKVDLSAAIRALAAQVSDDPDDHPEAEDLAALAAGTLAGFRRRPVEEHVAGCPECTAIVADLTEPMEAEGRVRREGEPGGAQEAAWARLERELGRGGGQVVPFERPAVAAPRPEPAGTFAWAQFRRWGVAASLLLCAGFGVWVAELYEDLAVANGPRPVAERFEAQPLGTATRGPAGSPAGIVIPLRSSPVTLFLPIRGERLSLPIVVEFLDARGRQVGRCENPAIVDSYAVEVSLLKDWLPPGRYEARLTAGGLAGPVIFPLTVE